MARSQASRLAACLAAAAVGCGNAPDASRSLDSLDAVARVQVVWWDATGARHSRAFGTAFRVGSQGDLLTAQHVAANARAQREKLGPQTRAKIHVAFDPTGSERGSEADGSLSVEVAITAEDRGVDLALLRIVPPRPDGGDASGGRGSAGGISQRGVARLASAPTPTESVVAVVGYPIGERDLVVRSGRLLDPVSLARSLGASESLPSWLDELLRDDAVLLAYVETRLGNSGAPIYLAESGEVIGLCSAVLLRNALARGELIPLPNPPGTPITVIIAAQRIQRFLDAHGVSAR